MCSIEKQKEMTKFTYKKITYQELKDGTYKNAYIPQDDKFPVTSHLTSSFRDTLLACPCNNDDSKTFMNVFVDEEGKEIGRDFRFGTRIKAGDRIYDAGTGCGFEVVDIYRGYKGDKEDLNDPMSKAEKFFTGSEQIKYTLDMIRQRNAFPRRVTMRGNGMKYTIE